MPLRYPYAAAVVGAGLVLAASSVLLTAGPSPSGESRPWSDLVVVLGVMLAGATLAFGLLAPFVARRPAYAGPVSVGLGVVALLGLPVLVWSGTSALLGAGAALLAADATRPLARVGRALGLVAVVVNLTLLAWFVADDFRPGLPG